MKSAVLALSLLLTTTTIASFTPAYAEDEAAIGTDEGGEDVADNGGGEEPGRGEGEETPVDVEIVNDGSIPDEILQSSAGGPEVQRDNTPDVAVNVARLETSRDTLDAGDWLAQLRKKKRK